MSESISPTSSMLEIIYKSNSSGRFDSVMVEHAAGERVRLIQMSKGVVNCPSARGGF